MSAISVAAARPANRQGGGGATPSPAVQQLGVQRDMTDWLYLPTRARSWRRLLRPRKDGLIA